MRCFCLYFYAAVFIQQKKALQNISIFWDYLMWKHSPAFFGPTITIITTSSLGNNNDDGNFTNWPDNIHYVFSFSPPFQRNVIGRSSVFPFPLFVQPHTHTLTTQVILKFCEWKVSMPHSLFFALFIFMVIQNFPFSLDSLFLYTIFTFNLTFFFRILLPSAAW